MILKLMLMMIVIRFNPRLNRILSGDFPISFSIPKNVKSEGKKTTLKREERKLCNLCYWCVGKV